MEGGVGHAHFLLSCVWLVQVTAGFPGAGLGAPSRLLTVEGWITSIMSASPVGAFSLLLFDCAPDGRNHMQGGLQLPASKRKRSQVSKTRPPSTSSGQALGRRAEIKQGCFSTDSRRIAGDSGATGNLCVNACKSRHHADDPRNPRSTVRQSRNLQPVRKPIPAPRWLGAEPEPGCYCTLYVEYCHGCHAPPLYWRKLT
jgi:hypothetical protein